MEAKTPKGHSDAISKYDPSYCTLYRNLLRWPKCETLFYLFLLQQSTLLFIYPSYLLSFIPSIFYLSAYMLCSKNIKLSRIRLKELCQLSVQHWCRIKTIIPGVTQHYREVDGHKSSLYA